MNKFLIIIFLVLTLSSFNKVTPSPLDKIFPENKQCVLIYFDKSNDQEYKLGKIYSTYLQNLLGHFPEIDQIISPIERYQKGEIEKCRSTIYIGSYFDNNIPKYFYDDFKTTDKNVAWLGYNIWGYSQEELSNLFGFHYEGLTTLDTENLNSFGNPSFYRYVNYKGETFNKFGEWVERNGQDHFAASFEQVRLKPDQEAEQQAQVLAISLHDQTGDEIPYAIRLENRFYVADIPFSYVHESDRYLVMADLLFDILDLPPRHQQNLAVMRIEDVHPLLPLRNLFLMQDVFRAKEIPLHIAIIPIFYDPLYAFDRRADQTFVPMTKVPSFMSWLESVIEDDGVFIWHGTTHQYSNIANPHSGYSGDDFEFWDANNNRPIEEDSVNYVLERLDLGMDYLNDINITPRVWLTPHYQASALNYYIFADVFEWNIGRAIYFLNEAQGLPVNTPPSEIQYSAQNGGDSALRYQYYEDLSVETRSEWFGQLYPYEIYGDVYGQRMIPEILGNPQPFTSDHVWYPRSLDQILEDARRNLVIRDSWASLFFHPYILTDLFNGGVGDYPGDTRPLEKLLREIKELGYKFISLDEFAKDTSTIKNVKRIHINLDSTWEIKR